MTDHDNHSSADSDLAAKLKATHQQQLALWEAIAGGHEPRCRDCADFHGRCQGSGLPCDPQERALEQINRLRTALPQAALKPFDVGYIDGIILAGLLDEWENGAYDQDTKDSAGRLSRRLAERIASSVPRPQRP